MDIPDQKRASEKARTKSCIVGRADVRNDWQENVSEKVFTKQVIDLAHWYKWKCAHFRPAMTKRGRWVTAVQGDGVGFPDLVMVRHADARLIFAELKTAKGKLSDAQDAWIQTLSQVCVANYTVDAYLWRPAMIEEIERILR